MDVEDCYDDYDEECDGLGYSSAPLHCSLCDCTLQDSQELLCHVLSPLHNQRLYRETSRKEKKRVLLKKLVERKLRRKETWKGGVLTKKLRYISRPEVDSEPEEGIEDNDDTDDDEDLKEPPLKIKPSKKTSKTSVPETPVNPNDLRNRINKMKEKEQEERKAEKRKKKNIRTREAKKRNKKVAREEKKRIEDALEALEEEDEAIAFMKSTMGFSKFQTTKRSYF